MSYDPDEAADDARRDDPELRGGREDHWPPAAPLGHEFDEEAVEDRRRTPIIHRLMRSDIERWDDGLV